MKFSMQVSFCNILSTEFNMHFAVDMEMLNVMSDRIVILLLNFFIILRFS